jgi:hypothetical protein
MIEERIVEETWQEVAQWSEEAATAEMMALAQRQPHLLAFVTSQADQMSEDGAELAVYLFFNIMRMFEKGAKKLKMVTAPTVLKRFDANEQLMEGLPEAHPRFFEQVAKASLDRQPYVMRYLVEALTEEPDEDDPVEIDEEDSGILFLLLKTVVDVLDEQIGDR